MDDPTSGRVKHSAKAKAGAVNEPGLVISLRKEPRTVRLKAIVTVQVAAVQDRKKRPAIRITGIELEGFGTK